MAGALINTGTTLFVKDGSNGGAVMTAPNQMAYVKSDNNRGGKKKSGECCVAWRQMV